MQNVIWVLRYSHFAEVLRRHSGHSFRHIGKLGRVQKGVSLPWDEPNEMIKQQSQKGTGMRLCSTGKGIRSL